MHEDGDAHAERIEEEARRVVRGLRGGAGGGAEGEHGEVLKGEGESLRDRRVEGRGDEEVGRGLGRHGQWGVGLSRVR